MVFNCTGLGARELFDDLKLGPVRGQLEVLLPQPEIDYCYLSGLGYMFPRRDGIILGGTFDHDDWSLEPNPEQTTRIFEAHAGYYEWGEEQNHPLSGGVYFYFAILSLIDFKALSSMARCGGLVALAS